MSLICSLGGHEAEAREVYNCGYHFSRCRRCGTDMIRAGASWSLVPEGHRVVWKAGRQHHSIEPDFSRVLPVLLPGANLPMVRPAFMSWSRTMAPRQRKTRANAAVAAEALAEAQAPEQQYPALLLFATIVGAGLQLVLGFGRHA